MSDKNSFMERLSSLKVLKWTTEPARTREDSLRADKVFGVTSGADLDRAIRARRAAAAASANEASSGSSRKKSAT